MIRTLSLNMQFFSSEGVPNESILQQRINIMEWFYVYLSWFFKWLSIKQCVIRIKTSLVLHQSVLKLLDKTNQHSILKLISFFCTVNPTITRKHLASCLSAEAFVGFEKLTFRLLLISQISEKASRWTAIEKKIWFKLKSFVKITFNLNSLFIKKGCKLCPLKRRYLWTCLKIIQMRCGFIIIRDCQASSIIYTGCPPIDKRAVFCWTPKLKVLKLSSLLWQNCTLLDFWGYLLQFLTFLSVDDSREWAEFSLWWSLQRTPHFSDPDIFSRCWIPSHRDGKLIGAAFLLHQVAPPIYPSFRLPRAEKLYPVKKEHPVPSKKGI